MSSVQFCSHIRWSLGGNQSIQRDATWNYFMVFPLNINSYETRAFPWFNPLVYSKNARKPSLMMINKPFSWIFYFNQSYERCSHSILFANESRTNQATAIIEWLAVIHALQQLGHHSEAFWIKLLLITSLNQTIKPRWSSKETIHQEPFWSRTCSFSKEITS